MTDLPILAETIGDILFLTLNRPQVMNVVDTAMSIRMAEIAETLPKLAGDARVIVLRGAGASFMAGGDVKSFLAHMPDVDQMLDPLIKRFHIFIEALAEAPQPVLCAVQGAAAGGGFSLAMACDLVIAADDVRFALAYRQLGTSTDGGASYTLPRLIGLRRSMEILLLSGVLNADDAVNLGLINRVVPLAALEAETMRVAVELASNSAIANASMKLLLRRSYQNNLAEQLELERHYFVSGSIEPDFREGVAAFSEKRKPQFAAVPNHDPQNT